MFPTTTRTPGADRRSRFSRRTGAIAVSAAAILAGTAAAWSAGAQAAAAGGVVHIYEVGPNTGNTDHDVLTGAFTDYGTDNQSATAPTGKMVLTKGTFMVNEAGLLAKVKPISENPATCSVVIGATGPVTLSHGTGAYKGISGTLKVTFTDAIINARKAGKCDRNKQLASITEVTGSGKVSF